MVDCKICGRGFESPIPLEWQTMDGASVVYAEFHCPDGHGALYDGSDHYIGSFT
ncbi:MAG TPA: hypothetical protein VGH94_06055 [Acidimicrobiales bacterium]